MWLQLQQVYAELVQGLLEKMTLGQTESVGITDAAFAAVVAGNSSSSSHQASSDSTAQPSHLKAHADLKYAIAILLLAAEALPETDVQFIVCRLLFNQARPLPEAAHGSAKAKSCSSKYEEQATNVCMFLYGLAHLQA